MHTSPIARWGYAIDVLREWQEVQHAEGDTPAETVELDIIAVIEGELGPA